MSHDHSNMDHSNMDHHDMDHHMDMDMENESGMNHAMHNHDGASHGGMMMYFHFSNEAIILFAGWQTKTALQMFGSCLLMIIVAALYEGLKLLREWLMKRPASLTKGGSVAIPTAEEPPHVATKHSSSWLPNIIQAILHMIQVSVSYVLMLVFMTYNVWLCLSIIIGAGLGYLLFGRLRSTVVDFNEHCH